MPTKVLMPQLGESIAEGTIVRWNKAVGDAIGRDEPLFDISTDKVDAEIPSPTAGVVVEIKVGEGETVPVDSVVAVIAQPGEVISEPSVPTARQGTRSATCWDRRTACLTRRRHTQPRSAADATLTSCPKDRSRAQRRPVGDSRDGLRRSSHQGRRPAADRERGHPRHAHRAHDRHAARDCRAYGCEPAHLGSRPHRL